MEFDVHMNYDDWFPQNYNPGITVRQWKKLIKDIRVFNKSSLEIMKRMLDIGGMATCTQLSDEYGESVNFYSNGSFSLAKRIHKATNCPLLAEDNHNNKWWTILYVGKQADRDERGAFVWKLRDELAEALKQSDLSGVELHSSLEYTAGKITVNYKISYSEILLNSRNIIFRGAPGTGKTYLARETAADIVSGGIIQNYSDLSDEQKKQIEFVQFHPSYDYSDFVEGLRPKTNNDDTMGFELKDGIFKKFVGCARTNLENSKKTIEVIQAELSVKEMLSNFFSNIEFGITEFITVNGSRFIITNVDDEHIDISIPKNENVNKLKLNLDEITKMLESGIKFNKVKDITDFFGKKFGTQQYSYDFALYKEIKLKKYSASEKSIEPEIEPEKEKKYVFIIDEINRGEISKILGELFFAIDPGYRGKAGEVSTQYSNLHSNPEDKFYIPENVYIIGTMNDIDRSVDSFDFAMRRRFRFINIKADEHTEMLNSLDESKRNEAIMRMKSLNSAIIEVEGLNENYQIGASYFLKLKENSFEQLWSDYLQPLLHDYIQGMYDEDSIMSKLEKAYNNTGMTDESVDY